MTTAEILDYLLLGGTVAVLTWSVAHALWSINRTMSQTRKLWAESEEELFRLRSLRRQLEAEFETRRSS